MEEFWGGKGVSEGLDGLKIRVKRRRVFLTR
jgi:hypothetical protein